MTWNYPAGFSAKTALEYLNLVQQVYFQYYENESTPPPYGFSGWPLQLPENIAYQIEVPGFLDERTFYGWVLQPAPGQLTFILRGTEGMEEWYDDIAESYQETNPLSSKGGMVHNGFIDIYQSLRYYSVKDLKTELQLSQVLGSASNTIGITGHSLGSALAILLAMDIASNYQTAQNIIDPLYTFALPKTGDPTFVSYFNSLLGDNVPIRAHYRVANGWDVVPGLPPDVYFFLDTEYDYDQVDALCPIDGGLTFDIVTSHSPSAYAAGLQAIKEAAAPQTFAGIQRRAV